MSKREIAQRARREDLPDPMLNPHSPKTPPPGASWPMWVQYTIYGALFFRHVRLRRVPGAGALATRHIHAGKHNGAARCG